MKTTLTSVTKINVNKDNKVVTESILNDKYTFSRLNMKAVTVEEATERFDITTTDYMTEEEQKQAILDDIMARVAIKKEEARLAQERAARRQAAERHIKKMIREDKKRWAPKNKAQAIIDAMGIDRREVVAFINQIEKHLQ